MVLRTLLLYERLAVLDTASRLTVALFSDAPALLYKIGWARRQNAYTELRAVLPRHVMQLPAINALMF